MWEPLERQLQFPHRHKERCIQFGEEAFVQKLPHVPQLREVQVDDMIEYLVDDLGDLIYKTHGWYRYSSAVLPSFWLFESDELMSDLISLDFIVFALGIKRGERLCKTTEEQILSQEFVNVRNSIQCFRLGIKKNSSRWETRNSVFKRKTNFELVDVSSVYEGMSVRNVSNDCIVDKLLTNVDGLHGCLIRLA